MDRKKYEWHGSDEDLTKLISEGKLVNPEEWKMIISVSSYLLKNNF